MNGTKPYVLDTSAVLALAYGEPGAQPVRSILFESVVSTVTLAEAYSVFSRKGQDGVEILTDFRYLIAEVIPFNERQAEIAGALTAMTYHAGLSLGDRVVSLWQSTSAMTYIPLIASGPRSIFHAKSTSSAKQ